MLAGAGALLIAASTFSQDAPIKLDVDATDAPRKILHARLRIPAQPGKLTLLYPKWIPGEHAPTGPITDLVGIKMSAAGRPVEWQRDAEDMFAFHLEVPQGANAVEVSLDFLLPPNANGFSSGASATAQLLVLTWNHVVLYPKGAKAGTLQYAATLRLPNGWKFGTALPLANESANGTEFAPVSLETLVDSPVLTGAHFRTVDLSPGAKPSHSLHIAADSAAALEMKPEDEAHFRHLVAETGALFGARHYRNYHFLLTLSDHVAHFGLEHHESSDNRQPEKYLTDPDPLKLMALLLPHEMTHSWNGKYRRPAGLVTPDFHQPMKTELLWVYEGLTDYLGNVLATRCGLWTNENFREDLALSAAMLDYQAGRIWRSLADTTVAAQLLYPARPEGTAWRRSVDFYPEGDLIWLEADVLIRQKTQGRRSLDDFCKQFHGGENSPPKIIPYTLDDVLAQLNGRPVLLGIDCDGDQKRTRVAPAKGAWLNVKQTYICLPYAKEYVEQAPCLDCDLELDAAFEERVYNYYGMESPYSAGTDPQSKLNKISHQAPTEKTGDSSSSPSEVSPSQSTHPTESHHDS